MKVDTFFQNFELLTDAPNATAKLRELILQLAVMGKLVRQDPNDEPALYLLEKIDNKKGKLIINEVCTKEKRFNIPGSWQWVYFERILNNIHYGYTASANYELLDVRLLRITDIQNNRVDWESVPGCEIKSDDFDKFKLQNGDLLIARTGGTIGKSFLVESISLNSVFASYLIRAVPSNQVFPKYIKIFLDSPLYWEQLYAKSMGTGQPNVNATSLKSLIIPLPPLAEQKRIVEKCDRLMSLCDQIEKQHKQKQDSIVRMNESAIAQLLSSQNPDDFRHHWERICNNFDLLYSVPETIPKLRQAILQLAVMGKLVKQDPNDEPAANLINKICQKKSLIIHNGQSNQNSITVNNPPYNLPKNWVWAYLDNIIISLTGGGTPSKLKQEFWDGNIPWASVKDLKSKYIESTIDSITDLGLKNSSTNLIKKGSIIICTRMALGKIAINTIDVAINQDLKAIQLPEEIDKNYFYNFYMTQNIVGTGVTVTGIRQKELLKLPVPIPPLAEQKRIVEKCDRLMSLCDTLEAKLKQGRESREKLMEVAAKQVLLN